MSIFKKTIMYTLLFTVIILCKNVYAFDSSNYKNRGICGNYELAAFRENGNIDTIDCFNNYEDAKKAMKDRNDRSLAILTKVNNQTTIVDALVALLDLTINPDVTYFYTNPNLSGSSYTYMDTGSLYGGVDGVHLESQYTNGWVVKVKTGNFTGWIALSTAEIVPVTWIKSSSSYTVTDDIRHNYVAKIQNVYEGGEDYIKWAHKNLCP